jgi:hypothetical protein
MVGLQTEGAGNPGGYRGAIVTRVAVLAYRRLAGRAQYEQGL